MSKVGADDFVAAHGLPADPVRARVAFLALPVEDIDVSEFDDAAGALNQLGLARRFVARYAGDSLHIATSKTWYHYDDGEGRFRPDESGEAVRRMIEVVDALPAEARAARTPNLREAIAKFWMRTCTHDFVSGASHLAAIHDTVARTAKEFDGDRNVVNAANGITIDLRTGEARASTREDMHAKGLGAAYRADAAADYREWADHIAGVFDGDEEMMRFLQRLCGYLLTGRTDEQKLFVWDGPTATSKSTTLGILQHILGDYAISVGADALTERGRNRGGHYQLALTPGKRLMAIYESDEGDMFDAALVKTATGEDELTVRQIYGRPFSFLPQFKPVLVTNHLPALDNCDSALARRLVRVPFERVVPENKRDPHLRSRLLKNSAGILRWMVEGAIVWYRDGLRPPKSVLIATRTYISDQDLLGRWLVECCAIDAAVETSFPPLFQSYRSWTETNNERRLSAKEFAQRLHEHGFRKRETTERDKISHVKRTVTKYVGLGLLGYHATTELRVVPGGR